MTSTEPARRKPLTLTAMRKTAARARRYGYFYDGVRLEVRCPECQNMIRTDHHTHSGTRIAQLDTATVEHLRYDCPTVGPDRQ